MGEMKPSLESAPTLRPGLLDVVRLDCSWAQVVGAGNHVNHLQTNEIVPIDWNGYRLVKFWGQRVKLLQEFHGQKFTPQEIDNIHYGPEQKEYPKLKKLVFVYGKYVRK